MNKKLSTLPTNVQNEVKEVLRVFDEVTVIFEYGQYKVTTGTAIKRVYAPDHEVIGYYKKDEVYSATEQILIYVEEFLSYPPEYKGKKDWNMIKKLDQLRKNGKQAIMQYDTNGNLEIKEIVEIVY